jgi:hypothetical protein
MWVKASAESKNVGKFVDHGTNLLFPRVGVSFNVDRVEVNAASNRSSVRAELAVGSPSHNIRTFVLSSDEDNEVNTANTSSSVLGWNWKLMAGSLGNFKGAKSLNRKGLCEEFQSSRDQLVLDEVCLDAVGHF